MPSPTHTENSLHPDKGPSPYVTANNALAHALKIEKPLQNMLSTLGISNYIIQVGFDKTTLQRGMILEVLYLTLHGDSTTFNEQTLSDALAGVFAPFPCVVYTRDKTYYIPIDEPTHKLQLLSSLQFKMNTLSTTPGTSAGAGGEGIPSGNDDEDRKGKLQEAPEHGEDDHDAGDDPGDPDPGQPSGHNGSLGGLDLMLKSNVLIKAGDNISHVVSMQLDALIKVGSTVYDPSWSGPKIGLDITKVDVASRVGPDQPLNYSLSQVEVRMIGCSTQPIVLGHTTPLDHVYANIETTFAAPHGATVMAGVGVNKGRNAETTASHWEVSPNILFPFEEAHMIDETHTFVDGGFWLYTPNSDFRNINRATFTDNFAPLGVFRTSEVAPAKLEMKMVSFWELPSQHESALSRRRQPIPVFANFIFGISTVVDLQNVPNQGMKVLLQDKSEAPLSEDPFRAAVKRSLQADLEVPLVSAIMGRAS